MIYIYIYIYMYVYIYIYIHVCIYMYIYIWNVYVMYMYMTCMLYMYMIYGMYVCIYIYIYGDVCALSAYAKKHLQQNCIRIFFTVAGRPWCSAGITNLAWTLTMWLVVYSRGQFCNKRLFPGIEKKPSASRKLWLESWKAWPSEITKWDCKKIHYN